MSAALSPTMKAELASVLSAKPDSIHDYDRQPEEWVRMAPKPTVKALMARGLLDSWWFDYPCGGYRGHLTEAGIAARREIRASSASASRVAREALRHG